MGKILFTMELPEPKLRKEQAPPAKAHKNAKRYSRKCKHKAKREEAPGDAPGASFFARRLGERSLRKRRQALGGLSWAFSLPLGSGQESADIPACLAVLRMGKGLRRGRA